MSGFVPAGGGGLQETQLPSSSCSLSGGLVRTLEVGTRGPGMQLLMEPVSAPIADPGLSREGWPVQVGGKGPRLLLMSGYQPTLHTRKVLWRGAEWGPRTENIDYLQEGGRDAVAFEQKPNGSEGVATWLSRPSVPCTR